MPYESHETGKDFKQGRDALAIEGTGNQGDVSYENVGKKSDTKIGGGLPKLDIQSDAEPKLKQQPLFEDNGRLASAIGAIEEMKIYADLLDNPIRQTAANSQTMEAQRDSYIRERDAERRRQMGNAIAVRKQSSKNRASDAPKTTQRLRLRTL